MMPRRVPGGLPPAYRALLRSYPEELRGHFEDEDLYSRVDRVLDETRSLEEYAEEDEAVKSALPPAFVVIGCNGAGAFEPWELG